MRSDSNCHLTKSTLQVSLYSKMTNTWQPFRIYINLKAIIRTQQPQIPTSIKHLAFFFFGYGPSTKALEYRFTLTHSFTLALSISLFKYHVQKKKI